MYRFAPETDIEAFDRYVLEHGGRYLQCSRWPKIKTTWQPRYYSGFDLDGGRVLSCLVLERHIPAIGRLWYVPFGTVSDMTDEILQLQFTDFIKTEMKANKAFLLVMDPGIPIRIDGELQPAGVACTNLLQKLGYTSNQVLEYYTYRQPVETPIKLFDADGHRYTAEELVKTFDKGVRYSLRLGTSRGLKARKFTWDEVKDDIDLQNEYMAILSDVSDRNEFPLREREYTFSFMKYYPEGSDLTMIYYDKALDAKLEADRQQELADKKAALETATKKKIKGLTNDIEVLENAAKAYEQRREATKDYPENASIPIAGGITIRYGKWAHCITGGAKTLLRNETRSSHYMNWLRLCDSIEAGMDYHELGSFLVEIPEETDAEYIDPMVPTADYQGLCDFKLSFGAQYSEHIGEFFLHGSTAKLLAYFVLMPKAKKILAGIARRRR